MKAPGQVQSVVHILDEPIPEAVKKRLLKTLMPAAASSYRPAPPPRKAKARNRKATVEEFDPLQQTHFKQPRITRRSLTCKLFHNNRIMSLSSKELTYIGSGCLYLKAIPSAQTQYFLEGVRSKIYKKLTEESLRVPACS